MDAKGTKPRRIAMINQKGGVGKTTTTVNVGAALARNNQRVLILDLDPQAHATLHLGVDTDEHLGTIYDLLSDPQLDPKAVLTRVRPNLDLIASETDLAAVEGELASHADRNGRMSRVLEPVLDEYDYILFDCPPSLGLLTINALAAATEVIIPMQAHFLALQGVGKLLETVELISQRINPTLRVSGVVLCAHDQQASHAQEVVDDLRGFFESARGTAKPWSEGRVFEPPVRRNIKLAESPSFGQTIFDYAPTAAGAKDYGALAHSIAAAAPRDVERQPLEVVAPAIEVRVSPAASTQASDECAASS
jgi:chromosome partitioning protein